MAKTPPVRLDPPPAPAPNTTPDDVILHSTGWKIEFVRWRKKPTGK